MQGKAAWRQELRARRAGMSPAMRAEYSAQICRRLVDFFEPHPSKQRIGGYWPIGSEADIRAALRDLARMGGTVCLPAVVMSEAPLQFYGWDGAEDVEMRRDAMGIPVGTGEVCVPDVMLVPLLGFDTLGGRLGSGKGYYDRTLEVLRRQKPVLTIGVGFACQEVADLPCETHDQRLDFIVTERAVMTV